MVFNVVSSYGGLSSRALSHMSQGLAWREARCGSKEDECSENTLSVSTIRAEFTNLLHTAEATPIAPPLPMEAELMTFEDMLGVASEVESEWRETLAVLSRR